jgi:hypothetical protein
VVGHNGLDETLGGELVDGTTRKRATEAKAIRDDGGGDQLVRGHLLQELLVRWGIHQDSIVKLITDLALGPLLQTLVSANVHKTCNKPSS